MRTNFTHPALEAARGVHDRDTAAACNARSNVYFKYAARISPRKFNDRMGGEVPGEAIKVEVNDSDFEDPKGELIRRLEEMAERIRAMSMMAAEMGDPPELMTPDVVAHRKLRAMISPSTALEVEETEAAARARFFDENPQELATASPVGAGGESGAAPPSNPAERGDTRERSASGSGNIGMVSEADGGTSQPASKVVGGRGGARPEDIGVVYESHKPDWYSE